MALPYAYRVTKVTIIGDCYSGAEEWSTGFYMGYASGDADLPTQQLADDIKTAWTTFFTAAASKISNQWRTTEIKVSSFGTDGKSDANDTIYSTLATPAVGATTNQYPPQVSLVATLAGSKARGIASKGRMYLPGIAAPVSTNAKLLSADVIAIKNGLVTFLTAVNASTATNNVVVLASHGQLTKDPLTGNMVPKVGGIGPDVKPVLTVRVGDVLDTQRRRRNGLTETYQSGTIS